MHFSNSRGRLYKSNATNGYELLSLSLMKPQRRATPMQVRSRRSTWLTRSTYKAASTSAVAEETPGQER